MKLHLIYKKGGDEMSTYEALDVMLNFGTFIFAMLAFITSVIFFVNAKKR
ncbi:putative holin-like toxin [Paenibacillus amylolyticus]